MQIRQLGAADAAPYHALRLRMLQLYPLSWVKERLAPVRGGPGFVLGAYSGVDIVGAVGIEVEERRKQRHKALLFGMYVAPEHAGHGAGRALLAECVARARRVDGLEQLYLTVTTSNDRAVRLYERAGFRVFGVEQHALKIGGEYFAKSHMVLCLQDLRLQEPC
jgi:ribosomal protein S18 acetylase RimI-like enzyme